MSSIEWTEQTWNPTTGCDRVSPGCDNCYALTMAKRLKGMGSAKYQTDGDPRTSGPGFGLAMHQDTLTDPLRWKKPRRVFVNSMSDLFHKSVTDDFIAQVFAVMALTPQHTYQILTKRHGRMRSLLSSPAFRLLCENAQAELVNDPETPGLPRYKRDQYATQWWSDFAKPLSNVWLGVSVEDQKHAELRIPALLDTPAAVRFLSCEPLLGPVDLAPFLANRLAVTDPEADAPDGAVVNGMQRRGGEWVRQQGLHWVIVGGESGPGARALDIAWVSDLIRDSHDAGAAPFVKQLGSIWARENNASDAKGGKPADWPEALRVREYPAADSRAAA